MLRFLENFLFKTHFFFCFYHSNDFGLSHPLLHRRRDILFSVLCRNFETTETIGCFSAMICVLSPFLYVFITLLLVFVFLRDIRECFHATFNQYSAFISEKLLNFPTFFFIKILISIFQLFFVADVKVNRLIIVFEIQFYFF